GGGNRLVIDKGGRADAFLVLAGFSSDNNSVLVTDAGSSLNSVGAGSALEIGVGGRNNSMIVSNGARVTSVDAYIGNGGSNSTVLVTGSGSQWTNTTTMRVGFSGVNNRLTITDSGRVDNVVGRIG